MSSNDRAVEPDTDSPDANTPSIPPFSELGLDARVLRAITDVGYETPSAIQAATIPHLLEGRDVVGLAQTGTGKTAAFALPVLSRIDETARKPQALVLAPTRELALQVAEACISYSKYLPDVNVLPIYGGQAYGIQLAGLRRGAQIVVGTPGRVIDHLEKGTLDISELRFVVLDEADEMLKMGFQDDVERILSDTPAEKQVALFSATMPGAIRRISKQYLNDAAEITVKAKTATNTNITQRYVLVSPRNKLDAMTRILEVEQFEAMIVFVRTKQETEDLAERLRARGFRAAAINGDIVQAQRERTIDQLKDGRLDILVATDVAARGLDVDRISHVVNYDIPHDTESYVHRIGRTGRAGRTGEALLFVTPRERRLLKAIERATRQELIEIELPSIDDVNEVRMRKFADSITASLEDQNLGLFRKLVEEYASEHDVPLADIAAALATQSRNSAEFLMKEPEPEPRRERRDRDQRTPQRGYRDRGDDGATFGPERRGRTTEGMRTYRIAVGKRQGVRPGAIVGAIANEGGLRSSDFGHISIRGDHSLVELPESLSHDTLAALKGTRISGVLIDLRPDEGAPAGRPGSYRSRDDRGDRGGYRGRDDRGDRGDRGGYRGRDDRGDRGDRGGYRGRDDRGDRGDRGGYRGRDDRGDRGDRGGFRGRSHGRD